MSSSGLLRNLGFSKQFRPLIKATTISNSADPQAHMLLQHMEKQFHHTYKYGLLSSLFLISNPATSTQLDQLSTSLLCPITTINHNALLPNHTRYPPPGNPYSRPKSHKSTTPRLPQWVLSADLSLVQRRGHQNVCL